MTFSVIALLLAALSPVKAMETLLNGKSACSPRTFEEAMDIVERDAASGKPVQQFVFGIITEDSSKAKKYLDLSRPTIRSLAENRNNPLAWYLLSVEANDFGMLKKAADGGNLQALNAMGSMLVSQAFETQSVDSNRLENALSQGFKYFNAAARKNDPNGFINLGTCYLRGFGCEINMELAFACFRTAAEAGHPEGMDNMSACYQFGHGVKADSELSLYWEMRGRAARGDSSAQKWIRDRK